MKVVYRIYTMESVCVLVKDKHFLDFNEGRDIAVRSSYYEEFSTEEAAIEALQNKYVEGEYEIVKTYIK